MVYMQHHSSADEKTLYFGFVRTTQGNAEHYFYKAPNGNRFTYFFFPPSSVVNDIYFTVYICQINFWLRLGYTNKSQEFGVALKISKFPQFFPSTRAKKRDGSQGKSEPRIAQRQKKKEKKLFRILCECARVEQKQQLSEDKLFPVCLQSERSGRE